MRCRKHPGGRSKLDPEQPAELPGLPARGPAAFGFSGEIRARGRAAQIIRMESGVSCHPARAGRILKRCGFSLQKLVSRAGQRNGDVIREWREQRFGRLKKPWPKAGPSCGPVNPGSACCRPCWRLGAGSPVQVELRPPERCQHDRGTVPNGTRAFLQRTRRNQVPGASASGCGG